MDYLISRYWLMECIDEGWIKFDTEKLARDLGLRAMRAQPEHYVEDEYIKSRNCGADMRGGQDE